MIHYMVPSCTLGWLYCFILIGIPLLIKKIIINKKSFPVRPQLVFPSTLIFCHFETLGCMGKLLDAPRVWLYGAPNSDIHGRSHHEFN